MSELRRKYDPQFREGAVRIVRETRKSIARVAEDLGRQRQLVAQLEALGHKVTLEPPRDSDLTHRPLRGYAPNGGCHPRTPTRPQTPRTA